MEGKGLGGKELEERVSVGGWVWVKCDGVVMARCLVLEY